MKTLFIVAWIFTCGPTSSVPIQYGLDIRMFESDQAAYAQYDEAIDCWERRYRRTSFSVSSKARKKPQLYRLSLANTAEYPTVNFIDLEFAAEQLGVKPAKEYVVVKSSGIIIVPEQE